MDLESLAANITAQQAALYRYARYLGADPATAEDLVQDTFLAAFRTAMPPETADERVCAAWLRGVTRNLFFQHCRRMRSSPVRPGADLLEEAEVVWKSAFLRSGDGFDYIEAVRKCIRQLPEKQRTALDMRYAQRKSRDEMARLLGMTEDGIKSLMRRIRSDLAECIRKRLALESV